jgi:predicted  nucleic acid-binding Zn-ribbon protein
MLPALDSLIALQVLDSAADAARRRLGELPATEQAIAARSADAAAALDAVSARIAANHEKRRALEKDVAVVDSRLARFEDHKAAVKTNQEYTALLHEIAGAKSEKDALEEQILVLLEAADGLAVERKAAEAAVGAAQREADTGRAALTAERGALEAELSRLAAERATRATTVEARYLATYDQLLKGRRGIAVARLAGETCTACHVRLRPHIAQMVRRNDSIVQCESCQRILFFEAPAAGAPA